MLLDLVVDGAGGEGRVGGAGGPQLLDLVVDGLGAAARCPPPMGYPRPDNRPATDGQPTRYPPVTPRLPHRRSAKAG